MQVSIESTGALERRMSVEVPGERITGEVDKRLKSLVKSARVDGFRPGKVPMSVIRRQYVQRVRQDVLGEVIRSSFVEAIKAEKLDLAGEPRIDEVNDKDAEGLGYTATFEVYPSVAIADLTSASIKRPVVDLNDQDVDRMIEKLRRQRQTWGSVERPAQDGDQVRISFKGSIDGEGFEGGEKQDVPLVLGSKSVIDGFEEGIAGAGAGETVELDLRFPEDYQAKQLAGKPVHFRIEVIAVAEPVLPEVDESFMKSFGVEDGDLETFRNDIRSNMERERDQAVKARVKDQVMDALVEAHSIELPKVLVEQEIDRLQHQAEQGALAGLKKQGLSLPRELFEDKARRRVTLGLLVGEIVKEHNIVLDKDRVRATVETIASNYDDPDEVVSWYYAHRDQLASVEMQVLEEQVVDWVVGRAQVVDEPMDFEALIDASKLKDSKP